MKSHGHPFITSTGRILVRSELINESFTSGIHTYVWLLALLTVVLRHGTEIASRRFTGQQIWQAHSKFVPQELESWWSTSRVQGYRGLLQDRRVGGVLVGIERTISLTLLFIMVVRTLHERPIVRDVRIMLGACSRRTKLNSQ